MRSISRWAPVVRKELERKPTLEVDSWVGGEDGHANQILNHFADGLRTDFRDAHTDVDSESLAFIRELEGDGATYTSIRLSDQIDNEFGDLLKGEVVMCSIHECSDNLRNHLEDVVARSANPQDLIGSYMAAIGTYFATDYIRCLSEVFKPEEFYGTTRMTSFIFTIEFLGMPHGIPISEPEDHDGDFVVSSCYVNWAPPVHIDQSENEGWRRMIDSYLVPFRAVPGYSTREGLDETLENCKKLGHEFFVLLCGGIAFESVTTAVSLLGVQSNTVRSIIHRSSARAMTRFSATDDILIPVIGIEAAGYWCNAAGIVGAMFALACACMNCQSLPNEPITNSRVDDFIMLGPEFYGMTIELNALITLEEAVNVWQDEQEVMWFFNFLMVMMKPTLDYLEKLNDEEIQ